jgi:chloride channel 7
MDPRMSMKLYPRPDTLYKKKSSLNFDLMRAKVFVERKRNKCVPWLQLIALMVIGLIIGFIASVMEYVSNFLINTKVSYTDAIIGGEKSNMVSGWGFFVTYSVLFAGLGSSLCVWWAPHSTGSGMAELMAYLNGIKSPGQFSLQTYIVRIIGCNCA